MLRVKFQDLAAVEFMAIAHWKEPLSGDAFSQEGRQVGHWLRR
jgi:hypothetical protein